MRLTVDKRDNKINSENLNEWCNKWLIKNNKRFLKNVADVLHDWWQFLRSSVGHKQLRFRFNSDWQKFEVK